MYSNASHFSGSLGRLSGSWRTLCLRVLGLLRMIVSVVTSTFPNDEDFAHLKSCIWISLEVAVESSGLWSPS